MGRIAASSQHRGPQAPIFQRAASADLPAEKYVPPLVQPLAVFAAGRKSFDVIVRDIADPDTALIVIIATLPLRENGWTDFQIERVGTAELGWPVWRVSRGP